LTVGQVAVVARRQIMSSAAEPAASCEDLLTLISVLREQNVALAERYALLEVSNAAPQKRATQAGGSERVAHCRQRAADQAGRAGGAAARP
jgi:hypothetical protein